MKQSIRGQFALSISYFAGFIQQGDGCSHIELSSSTISGVLIKLGERTKNWDQPNHNSASRKNQVLEIPMKGCAMFGGLVA
jgi:hypothetical protein